jgi:hypothetical protein
MIARLPVLLLACGALCHCHSASSGGAGKADALKCQRELVSSLWRARMNVVKQSLDDWEAGRTVDAVKLDAAVSELIELSGIEGPVPNYVGYVPGDELQRSFAAWKHWFQEHGACLRFNEETGSLERRQRCAG